MGDLYALRRFDGSYPARVVCVIEANSEQGAKKKVTRLLASIGDQMREDEGIKKLARHNEIEGAWFL